MRNWVRKIQNCAVLEYSKYGYLVSRLINPRLLAPKTSLIKNAPTAFLQASTVILRLFVADPEELPGLEGAGIASHSKIRSSELNYLIRGQVCATMEVISARNEIAELPYLGDGSSCNLNGRCGGTNGMLIKFEQIT